MGDAKEKIKSYMNESFSMNYDYKTIHDEISSGNHTYICNKKSVSRDIKNVRKDADEV